MKKIFLILTLSTLLLSFDAINESPTLNEALDILKSDNLEIQAAALDIGVAKAEADAISGMQWGKLEFTQDIARSNDAGNVFGFKLSSREASFGDFGFSEFNPSAPKSTLLNTQPRDLNYPEDRNYFQSKLKYEVPLFTGFALSSYSNIMNSMAKMKSLEKEQVINEKIYQLKKSYYDMALLDDSIEHLNIIMQNIDTLEDMTESMINVGYAKHIDLLEVKAKKGNVQRVLQQMNANKTLLYHYISFLLNKHVTSIQTPTSQMQMPNFDDEYVLKNNLDIQKATTGLAITNDMRQANEAGYLPTLGMFGEVSTADNTFLGDAADHQAYTVGARLSWNLFNGGIDSAKIQKAKLEQLKTQTQFQLARNGISLELAKIRTEIKSADEDIASLKQELEFADAIYKNYEGRYKEKLSSMSDVIVKQTEQIQKILQLQIAKNKRNEKIFSLENLANGAK